MTGSEALATYEAMGTRLAEEVVEGDALAIAVRTLIERGAPGVARPGSLLAALDLPERLPRGWPTTPRAISGALRRVAPTLRAVGVSVEHQKMAGSGSRVVWTLTRTEESRDGPTQPTQPTQ